LTREKKEWRRPISFSLLIALLLSVLPLAGCGEDGNAPESVAAAELSLPELEPAGLDGRRLRVVATTDIIGGVVGEIGGDRIDLVALMATGQDPHSYEPSTGDLAAVANADVIFINGWRLEEGLLETVERTAEHGPLAPISAGVTPLMMGEAGVAGSDDEGGQEVGPERVHGSVDPHVWLDPHNVIKWAENASTVLSALDPAHADAYAAAAAAYVAELEELIDAIEDQTAQIPPQQRKLVVTHDSLRYFAHRFSFDIVGAIVPGSSTLAEPSAGALADLIAAMEEAGVCTVFVESTVNRTLAETVAAELNGCDDVHILEVYTGSLGPEDTPAGNYIGMMRANLDAIVSGLTG